MEQAGECAIGRSDDSGVCQWINVQDAVMIGVRRRAIQFFSLGEQAGSRRPTIGRHGRAVERPKVLERRALDKAIEKLQDVIGAVQDRTIRESLRRAEQVAR